MLVTFLIGNGFDLNLGLETRYEQFYRHYTNAAEFPTEDPDIILFKTLLQKKDSYTRWADFERALGEHTTEPPLDEEASLRKCLKDFKRCFALYLQEQEDRIDFDACGREMAQKFVKDLRSHWDYLESRSLSIIKSSFPKEYRWYRFLDFNYTKVIDRLISYADPSDWGPDLMDQIIHVHGTHTTGMILGVDNITQVANPDLFTGSRQQRLLLKPLLNQQSASGSDADAWSSIRISDEICIFGMSLGETDATWWKRISLWLTDSSRHQLLIFSRGKNLDPLFPDEILDHQDDIRDLFFSRSETLQEQQDSLRDRIHVVIAPDFFDLGPILDTSSAGDPTAAALV